MKLAQYSSSWCSSCKSLQSLIQSILPDDYNFEYIDIDDLDRMELMKAGIKGIPTLILYDNQGNEIKRKTGALTKEQLRLFLGLDWIAVSAKQLDNT